MNRHCPCDDWKENIDKLNGPIQLAEARNPNTGAGYTGKYFKYCPWCGAQLNDPSEHYEFFKLKYDKGEYEHFCNTYCHEGLRLETQICRCQKEVIEPIICPTCKNNGVLHKAMVCSHDRTHFSKQEAIKLLATDLLEKLRKGEVDEGC